MAREHFPSAVHWHGVVVVRVVVVVVVVVDNFKLKHSLRRLARHFAGLARLARRGRAV